MTAVTSSRPRLGLLSPYAGWILALLVLLASILFVELTRMRPEYDAYGWLVWGRQALHFDLNTNGAPSWKPLPFLFTFPYALAGGAQPWLWMVTSTAAAFSAPVLAARLAYRLTGRAARPYARIAAALFAGMGILGLVGFWPLVLIASRIPSSSPCAWRQSSLISRTGRDWHSRCSCSPPSAAQRHGRW